MTADNVPAIVIVGGYGVFGGFLAERLIGERAGDVFIAGRSRAKAAAWCDRHGGIPLTIDRNDAAGALRKVLDRRKISIVVDASGPFEYLDPTSSYALALAAFDCRAHYVDLADDCSFAVNFHRLDAAARAAGTVAICGASSVPALSSAAVRALSRDMAGIDTIETVILPGNQTRRGLAVVRSILRQAGTTFRCWKCGDWKETIFWGWPIRLNIEGNAPIKGRWASEIRVPDTELFPDFFKARSVVFRAGLELPLLHFSPWLLGLFVRSGLVKSARPFSRLGLAIANLLQRAGTDRGGMTVSVKGRGHDGTRLSRRWSLIAEAGDGPRVPPTPAYIIISKILDRKLNIGARPALCVFTLEEAERALSLWNIGLETLELPDTRN